MSASLLQVGFAYKMLKFVLLVCIQVYERAMEVFGSEEEMEKARLKKVERREKQQQKKFDKNVKGTLCKSAVYI